MADRRQEPSKLSRIAVVGRLREFALVTRHAQGLHIFDAVRAAARQGLNMIHRQLIGVATAQARTTKPSAHRKPITAANFGTGFPYAAVVLMVYTVVTHTLGVLFSPLPSTFFFSFYVLGAIDQAFLISFYAVLCIVVALLLPVFLGVDPILIMLLAIHTITILGSVSLPALLAMPLNSQKIPRVHSKRSNRLPFIAVGAFAATFGSNSRLRIFSPNQFLGLIVRLLTLNTPRVMPISTPLAGMKMGYRKPTITTAAVLNIKEGMLYNLRHRNLLQDCDHASGCYQQRGGFVLSLNYSTFVALDQGFTALGGFKCL